MELEEHGKLILGSCQKDFPTAISTSYINAYYPISCNVQGASPGDNVVVSSTPLGLGGGLGGVCSVVTSSSIKQPNVVSILLLTDPDATGQTEGHDHYVTCEGSKIRGTVIFSIIVFRPTDLDIIGTLEELLKLFPNASKPSE
ncbi:MAG: hypothetical protein QN720_09605 [Nitrososphaeraceae archaeon]|nr:hypothetical protein [Nitrososphaeraceae archaeon]MDW0333220.1 hypothetical protein [Nitrososphaeraceae archaeon]